jgi:hypothetical protein
MIRLYCPPGRAAARAWVAGVVLGEVLQQDFRLEPQPQLAGWRLTLDGADGELHLPDLLLGLPEDQWLDSRSLPRQPLGRWTPPEALRHSAAVPAELPILYGEVAEQGYLAAEGSTVRLGLDVFGSAFFLLSRYEEYATAERGEYGWFPLERNALARSGALERPLVNEYAELLWKLLRQLWPGLTRPLRRSRLVPTHDVDVPWGVYRRNWLRHLRSAGADLALRRDPALAWRRLATAGQVRRGAIDADVNNTFDWIMRQSEQRGLTSTFYFLVDDANFQLEHPWVLKLLQTIEARGHRLGVHPPLGTAQDPPALKAAVDRFRSALRLAGLAALADSALPGRQHYLQWDPAQTWPAYAAAGLGRDSSCGFPQRIGFRAGICQPFQPFDLRRMQALPLVEEPLCAMEVSLLAAMFEHVPLARAVERLIRLGQVCQAFGGDYVLLWHNDGLIGRRQQAAYMAVLEALAAS